MKRIYRNFFFSSNCQHSMACTRGLLPTGCPISNVYRRLEHFDTYAVRPVRFDEIAVTVVTKKF